MRGHRRTRDLNRRPRGRRSILLGLLLGCISGVGVVGVHAFTLIVATVTVTPTSGLAADSFTARATFQANCSQQPPLYTFDFYWDTNQNKPLWTTTVPCDLKNSQYDTGQPSLGATGRPGRRRLARCNRRPP